MATPTAIPVTITPEAAVRVAELGMQRELDEMVQHALETISDLQSIQVVVELPYDTGEEDRITIEATIPPDAARLYQASKEWSSWVISMYHPDVWTKMNLLTVSGATS